MSAAVRSRWGVWTSTAFAFFEMRAANTAATLGSLASRAALSTIVSPSTGLPVREPLMRPFGSGAAISRRSPATNAAVSSTASWGLVGATGVAAGAGAEAVASAVGVPEAEEPFGGGVFSSQAKPPTESAAVAAVRRRRRASRAELMVGRSIPESPAWPWTQELR